MLPVIPNRQVVRLHTIDEWYKVDVNIRSQILQKIRAKERLHDYLKAKSNAAPQPLDKAKWVACRRCNPYNETPAVERGWVLLEPRYPGIHPSQLSDTCMLKIYNTLIGKDEHRKIEPRLQLTFDLGHRVHEMFQAYGKDGAWGPHYEPEVVVSGEFQELARQLMLEGHADADTIAIIDNIPGAPIYEVGVVHEYKSMNSNQYKDLTRAKAEHKQQATVYCAALNRPVKVFIYFNKDTSALADFVVQFERAIWEPLAKKCGILIDHYNKRSAPKGNPGFKCTECGYQQDCSDYRAYFENQQRNPAPFNPQSTDTRPAAPQPLPQTFQPPFTPQFSRRPT